MFALVPPDHLVRAGDTVAALIHATGVAAVLAARVDAPTRGHTGAAVGAHRW